MASVVDTGKKFVAGVVVTGDKFIAGVVVTSDNCSPVSLTLVRNLSPVSLTLVNSLSPVSLTPVINIHSRISPQILKKIETEYLGARVTMIHEKNLKSKICVRLPLRH
jgi:hypothetical protein